MSWKFLSYALSSQLSAYGDGERISIEGCKDMHKGDTCNTARITLPNHYGTHIDFPRHFSLEGKGAEDYAAGDFVFSAVQYISVERLVGDSRDLILTKENLVSFELSPKTEALILDFGFWKIRNSQDYLFKNPSLHPGLAKYLKTRCPQLKMIIMDTISLNPWCNKPLGRESHKEFLLNEDILIVEDADFSSLENHDRIHSLVIAPLIYSQADGCPVTILARL